MKFHTTLVAKADIVKPKSDEFKSIAASLKDRYGFELKPQMDLLYVRSCLVSAGPRVGINENDDIFTREEVWAARHSPILKPFNWQHDDKNILGVIYTVQARDLDGSIIDINSETVPNRDFDLWVEAAIFSLIHPDRAEQIEERAKAGSLFVSMEAWFDDYGYGLCDPNSGHLGKIVARNQTTSFLDRHLRAGGGMGVYRDPESNQDLRIGRVLRSITFGGCGFVDRPANKRSVIEAVQPMNSLKPELETRSQIEILLQKVLESQTEKTLMNTQASAVNPEELGAILEGALDKREKAAAEKRAHENLITRANTAEQKAAEMTAQVEALTQAKQGRETELQALQVQLDQYGQAVESLVKDAVAGATGSTPAEIAAIDNAGTGEAAFNAKIAWLKQSLSSLKARAARAVELETQLAAAESVVREQEVRSLLGEVVSPEALETFVTHAATLDANAYAHWRDEKELMVLEITRAAKKPPFPPVDPAKKGMKEEKSADKGCANLFEALLIKRRAESGTASPDTPTDMGHLINHPGGPGIKSGVNPAQLSTPRHKIAGSAGDNPAKALESAQAEGGVSLAGAQAGDDGEPVNPFRSLANVVVSGRSEEKKEAQERPGFDPVQ